MKKKLVRYFKRAFALVVPWVLVRILVNGLNYLLGLLDPGWLVIVLMVLMDEAAPPVAAFFALCYQYYKELEEDGELEYVLGHKSSGSALESSCSDSSQQPDNKVYRRNKPEQITSPLLVPDVQKVSIVSYTPVDPKAIDYSLFNPKNSQKDTINLEFITEAQWHAARKAEKHANEE